MFEVGKKYFNYEPKVIIEILWMDDSKVLVKYENGQINLDFLARFVQAKNWKEYKEPIDITRYLIVYENYHSKEIEFMCVNYISEEEARHDIHPNHKIINVYPITRTIN